jgi:ABC-2 type transport system ATP-binding protein
VIEIRNLSKRYGAVLAVDGLTFEVTPGKITGFLGPNGAGKSTTMRLVLGLDAPTSGTTSIAGRAYRSLEHPLREVGALLDAGAVHGGRTAVAHLRSIAATDRISPARVTEVLDQVGITTAARRRIRTYSLGMKQRLGVAYALLGDPELVFLDEPTNGLDPAGVAEVRELVRSLGRGGRTVILSSHLLSEVQQVADYVAILSRGRLLVQGRVADLLRNQEALRIRTTDNRAALDVIRTHPRVGEIREQDGALLVGISPDRSWELTRALADNDIYVAEMAPVSASLERYFLELTGEPAAPLPAEEA